MTLVRWSITWRDIWLRRAEPDYAHARREPGCPAKEGPGLLGAMQTCGDGRP
jgi:hypothetical protein